MVLLLGARRRGVRLSEREGAGYAGERSGGGATFAGDCGEWNVWVRGGVRGDRFAGPNRRVRDEGFVAGADGGKSDAEDYRDGGGDDQCHRAAEHGGGSLCGGEAAEAAHDE